VLIREFSLVTAATLSYFAMVERLLQALAPPTFGCMTVLAGTLNMLSAAGALAIGPAGQLLPLLRDAGPAGTFARRLMPVPLILPVAAMIIESAMGSVLGSAGSSGAILSSLGMLVAIIMVWASSNQVLHSDLLRRKAEADVRSSRDDLDRRVHLRTQELQEINNLLAIEVAGRQRAQDELEQTNTLLNSIIEVGPLAICAFHIDGSVRRANAAAHEILLPPDERCRDLVQRAARGRRFVGFEFTSASRTVERRLSVWVSPIFRADGGVDCVVVIGADISERKALEQQLQQTQRLESLGVLAGGIAHDFNNLLTGVIGNADLLREQFPAGTTFAAAVNSLVEAGDRMAKLTSQMLAYSGRGRFTVERLALSDQVKQITSLIHASIPRNVELVQRLADDLPAIEADSGQMQQVIINQVTNAVEAIGAAQGLVEIETSCRFTPQNELEQTVTGEPVPAGDYVILEVRDTGSGMDPEILTRIFDPFFTTKFTGRGLGLSAVIGIVRAHRGALTVSTQPKAVTTFRVFLPASRVRGTEAPGSKISAGSGKVLVLDDEEMVGRTAQVLLEQAGFQVVIARDGAEAIQICESMAGEIRVALLDMTMPVMSGEETLARIAARICRSSRPAAIAKRKRARDPSSGRPVLFRNRTGCVN
jgi:nitrogen-specific signal transduction histidine kinase